MKMSTKARYGLYACAKLAQDYDKGFISTTELANAIYVSDGYLEQIVSLLKKEGVVLSQRGAFGGYMCFRHKLLRHLAADAVFLQRFAQGFGDSLLFLPHLLGINILFECLYDQNMETWKEKNLCWHQG